MAPCRKALKSKKKTSLLILSKRQSERNDDTAGNQLATEKKLDLKQVISIIPLHRVKITMRNLIKKKNKGDVKVLDNLYLLFSQLKKDYNVICANAQKVEQITKIILNFISEISDAHKQRLEALRDILKCFIQQREEMEQEHQEEYEKLAVELENDIDKLKEKFTEEGIHSGREAMRKSICQLINSL